MQEHETKAAIDKLRDCESRFRQMAENIREVFFLVEAGSGRVMYLSPAYEEIWGRSCASVYADPDAWIEAVHPDDGAAVREHYGKGLAGGNLQYEYRIVRPDGAMRWIERRDFPVHDAAGRITRVAGVASDVTERKWVALELSDSKLRLDSIVTSAMDAIVSVDDGHRIVLANAAAEQMFGYAEGELLGKPLDQLLPPRFQVAHAAQIAGFSKAGTTSRKMGSLRPVSGVRRNGEKFTIEVSISRNESTGRRVFTAILRDVTERNRVLGALHESERRFSELLGNVELASVMLDRQARVTFCNDSLLRLTGWQREEVVGRSWFEVFLPSMRGDEDAAFGEQLDGTPGAWHLENEIVTRSGELRRMRWHSVVLRSTDGVAIGSASLGEDITEQRRAEIRVRRLNRVYGVLSQINNLIVRARDRDELFRGACGITVELGGFYMAFVGVHDPGARRIVPVATAGGDAELMTGIESALASGELAPQTMIARAIAAKAPAVSNASQDDERVVLSSLYAQSGIHSMAALPLVVGDEAIGALVLYSVEPGFFHEEEMQLLNELTGDIAFAIDHIEKGERLSFLAYYDALTGLANQVLFVERLQQKLLSVPDDPRKTAVFLFDIDHFKTINDAYGRGEGDALLKQVAERIVDNGGGTGRFARIGADRFAVVASDFDNVEQIGAYLERKLEANFHDPYRVGDSDLRISVKVGIALSPEDGIDADALLRHAEAALKKAKATGERYLFFTQQMSARVAERLSLENRLRQALDNEEFVLHYQPKVNLDSGLLTSAEALIRWNDPRAGLVPPVMFIPILEETGLIHPVGRWAMRKAIDDYLCWRNAGLAAVRIAVNVSPLQLRNRDFVAEIEQVLGMDAHARDGLELEITESLIMENVKHSIASLHAIRAMGVSIAIDDFGTGFSSLSYLSKLPVDTLKIDRSFIIDMTTGPEGLSLVSAIINLAHSVKLKVVAEGVETEEQSRLLRLLRCDEMQGYLFSKPVPADVFKARFLAPTAPAA